VLLVRWRVHVRCYAKHEVRCIAWQPAPPCRQAERERSVAYIQHACFLMNFSSFAPAAPGCPCPAGADWGS
jgi:hypothetical protein